MNWLGENEIPFVMVFTKMDKLGKAVVEKNLAAYHEEMFKSWEELPQIFITSAERNRKRGSWISLKERSILKKAFLV